MANPHESMVINQFKVCGWLVDVKVLVLVAGFEPAT